MSEWSDGVRSHRATDSDLNESVLTGTDDEWENDISNVRSKIGGGVLPRTIDQTYRMPLLLMQ